MRKLYFLIALFLIVFQLEAQDIKVVGYYPYYRFDLVESIDFSKITHLNLAFLNPDLEGNLSIGGKDIDPIVTHARNNNSELKVFISIAGGGLTEEMSQAYDKFLKPENQPEFVESLVAYSIEHNLDGIDVDLEWSHVDENYSSFVLLLADSLAKRGMQISAALPGTHRYANLSNEAMQAFDFINLMAYDKTGPWNPSNPGQHSSREFAEQSIDYWRNQGLADEKSVLGVPFYGWDFTNISNITAFTFGTMVRASEHNAYTDQVGEKYYNGIPTIQYKTLLAMTEVSGIMIWEIGQDALNNISGFSLLSAIDHVVKTGTLPVTSIKDVAAQKRRNLVLDIFPNPVVDIASIAAGSDTEIADIRITNLNGSEISIQTSINSYGEAQLDLSNIPAGMYLLTCQIDRVSHVAKLVKQ